MISSRALAVVLSVALASPTILVHRPARADVSAADKETARTLMAQGRKARDAGDHKAALDDFKKADAIMNVPTTKLEVGHEYEALNMLVEARDAYLAAVRAPTPPQGDPPPYVTARKEAEAKADALEPRIPSIKLSITGVPNGTQPVVTIDDETISNETIDVPRKSDPGAHTIVVKAGAAEKKQDVELAEGETKEVAIAFEASDFPPAEEPPSFTSDLPPEPPKPEAPKKSSHTIAWVSFGVGGAALVAGVVTGFMSMSKTSSLKDDCPNNQCPASKHDDLNSAKSLATISTISFVVAGVGATVGVIDLLVDKGASSSTEPAPTTAKVQLYFGVGSAGVQGAF